VSAPNANATLTYVTSDATVCTTAPTLRSIRIVTEPDDISNNDSEGLSLLASAERRRSFGIEWDYIEIRAKAEICVSGVIQHISSGGRFSIDSSSDDDYLVSEGEGQYAALVEILAALGIAVDIPFSEVVWAED